MEYLQSALSRVSGSCLARRRICRMSGSKERCFRVLGGIASGCSMRETPRTCSRSPCKSLCQPSRFSSFHSTLAAPKRQVQYQATAGRAVLRNASRDSCGFTKGSERIWRAQELLSMMHSHKRNSIVYLPTSITLTKAGASIAMAMPNQSYEYR